MVITSARIMPGDSRRQLKIRNWYKTKHSYKKSRFMLMKRLFFVFKNNTKLIQLTFNFHVFVCFNNVAYFNVVKVLNV
jgi:hypothetical protein